MPEKNNRRLILSLMLGFGTSITPAVVLMYGISQFHIIRLVGEELATEFFATGAGIVSLFIIFLSPLGGWILDRTEIAFGRRRFWIMMGSILGAISMLWFASSSSIFELTLAWIAVNFSYGLATLSYQALIPEQVEAKHFGRVSGLIGAVTPLTVMVFSIIVMGYFASLALQYKIILIAVVQLLFNLPIALIIDDSSKKQVTPAITEQNASTRYIYPSIKKYPEFTWTLLSRLCLHFANAGLTMMTLFYIARFNLDEKSIFELNALSASGVLLMVLAGISGGYLSDKLKRQKPLIMLSACLAGICMCLYALSNSLILVIVTSFIFQFAFGLFNAVDLALINRILPSKDNYAKDIAFMNMANHIARGVVNFTAPALLAAGKICMGDDGYTLYFLVMGIFSLLSALLIIPVPEMNK